MIAGCALTGTSLGACPGVPIGADFAPALDIVISKVSSPTIGVVSIIPTASLIVISPEIKALSIFS